MNQRPIPTVRLVVGAIALAAALTTASCSKGSTSSSTTSKKSTTTTTTTTAATSTTRPRGTSSTTTTTAPDLAGFDASAQALSDQTTADFAGYWTGDWGDLVMRVEGDGTVVAAYDHDTGQIVAHVDDDGILRGWWCEAPSRQPSSDAGTVEMRLVEGASGPAIDGRWTYGEHPSGGTWKDNWDIAQKGSDAAPTSLTSRLDAVVTECVPPAAK